MTFIVVIDGNCLKNELKLTKLNLYLQQAISKRFDSVLTTLFFHDTNDI